MRAGVVCSIADRPGFGVVNVLAGQVQGLLAAQTRNQLVLFGADTRRHAEHCARRNLESRPSRAASNRILRVPWEQMLLPGLANGVVDVLHAPSYTAPLRSATPIVVTIHDLFSVLRPSYCRFLNRLHHGVLLRKTIERATRIITLSRRVREQILQVFPVDPSRVVTISPGVDATVRAQASAEEVGRVRKRYGLPARFILWTGNLEPKKNVATMLNAFRRARHGGLGAELVMTGGIGWGAITPSEVRAAGARWLGFVSRRELALLRTAATMALFPSLDEGYGLPVIEAMAAGVPVIASGVPAVMETDPAAVRIIDPNDDLDIAGAMVELADDAALRSRLIERGRAATEDLTWESHGRVLWQLYEDAV